MEQSERPWGNYKIIEKTKIITVKPNSKLSLQYHNHRDEFWKVISGEGKVIINNEIFEAKKGDTFTIPKKVKHRVITENSEFVFLEIATGDVDEEDIVRLEDDYDRIKSGGEE
ncbi:mannose-6-phosphate isomerase [Candidatus Pacearchaeota archaeon CG10_big_fil_rev_8_21_14_0_10_34_12]|nr:MAG: mannose-6-phosphate isomerase [Candidatus Pacearchaeota archaeon CG10_big_fil_rev_8_21_14_0_10_34_12]